MADSALKSNAQSIAAIAHRLFSSRALSHQPAVRTSEQSEGNDATSTVHGAVSRNSDAVLLLLTLHSLGHCHHAMTQAAPSVSGAARLRASHRLSSTLQV